MNEKTRLNKIIYKEPMPVCNINYSENEHIKKYNTLLELYENLESKIKIYENALNDNSNKLQEIHKKYDELFKKYQDLQHSYDILLYDQKCKNICNI